ncbi:MAG: cytochrome c oxidase subunit II [Actinobacteria bacterium]|uniref:cytochrome-c oxidase n=1 Tax=freshwater metagenome TaxID=449393 RepID=A0A6J5ZFM5_9ZZZZ|nr:cytochrome c oxidase subunit II [Actinomycetota bacterium]
MRALIRSRPAQTSLLGAIVVVGCVLAPASTALAGVLGPDSAGGSPNAEGIRSLYFLIFAIALIIFVGVGGLIAFTVYRFRARPGVEAQQTKGNNRLEIGWTVGAALVLVLISLVTFLKLDQIRNPPNSDANGVSSPRNASFTPGPAKPAIPPNGRSLNIDVTGQQYLWRYSYADADTNSLNNVFSYEQMVVPTGTTVSLRIRAQDVQHSWWIPDLGGKFDAVPGYTNYTWFKISEPGVYRGQCAELCGRGHATMIASVKAVSPAAFRVWYAEQKAAIAAAKQDAATARNALLAKQEAAAKAMPSEPAVKAVPAPAAAIDGKKIFVAGVPATGALACGSCHALKDAGSNAAVGPNLDVVLKPDNAAMIKESILYPNKEIAKGYAKGIMPLNYGKTLTSAQLNALVKYIDEAVHGK